MTSKVKLCIFSKCGNEAVYSYVEDERNWKWTPFVCNYHSKIVRRNLTIYNCVLLRNWIIQRPYNKHWAVVRTKKTLKKNKIRICLDNCEDISSYCNRE